MCLLASTAANPAISCLSFAHTAVPPPPPSGTYHSPVLDQIPYQRAPTACVLPRALCARGALTASGRAHVRRHLRELVREQRGVRSTYKSSCCSPSSATTSLGFTQRGLPATSRQIPGAFEPTRTRGVTDPDARLHREDGHSESRAPAHLGAAAAAHRQGPLRERGLHRRAHESQLDALQEEFVTEHPMRSDLRGLVL